QGLGRDAFTLVNQSEHYVLRADVVVVEHPSLFLGQDDNPTCAVGEPLEHVPAPSRAVVTVPPSTVAPACNAPGHIYGRTRRQSCQRSSTIFDAASSSARS